MTIGFSGLFTKLGKGIKVIESINTSRGTTIPADVAAFLAEYNGESLVLQTAASGAETAQSSYDSGANSAVSSIQTALQTTVIEVVHADTELPSKTLQLALEELVRQMVAEAESVDAPTVSASASAITGNGDGVLVVSAKREDGLACEYAFAELVKVTCTSASTPATASFTAKGEVAEATKLAAAWPKGSGCNQSLTAVSAAAASSLLTNGDFEDFTYANQPDGWVISVGTIGTTLKQTTIEVQQIAISGSPSAGTYLISWTNAASKVQSTVPLAYNATGATVQAALRELVGLESVTVETSGTTPNYTHVITFTGVAGNVAEVTVTNRTTGGSFAVSTTTAGSANAFIGYSLEFDSNGSELTAINCPVELEALSQYAFNGWWMADVPPAAGVMKVELIDGIGGSVINDEAGTANAITIDCTTLTTSFVAKNGVFRTPRVLPPIVYLRIRISTAISSGSSVFIDHCALSEMTVLYTGGPSATVFSGKTSFTGGAGQEDPDYFTITVANNRAGEFQEWFERLFSMTTYGLQLPSDGGGTETINDSLIA